MTLTKDDFPVGTRVRVVKFPFQTTNPQIGTTGTVVKSSTPSPYFVDIRRDGAGDGDEFPYRPSELEIIGMPRTSAGDLTFAIGDRVEYRNDESPNHPDNGRQGEVVGFGSYGPKIKWDDLSSRLEFPFPENVRHVGAAPASNPEIAVGTRVRLDDSDHWSSLAAGKTATVAKVTTEGQITLDVDDEDFHQWTRVDNPHFTVLDPEPVAEPTFAPGDVVRVKDDITLDNGEHNGQIGTVTRIGVYYVWAQVPTSSGPVPFNAEELTHVEPEPDTPDLAASIRARVSALTDDLDEVNIVIAEASEKRDALRQDIAALKNAAARLEAQK